MIGYGFQFKFIHIVVQFEVTEDGESKQIQFSMHTRTEISKIPIYIHRLWKLVAYLMALNRSVLILHTKLGKSQGLCYIVIIVFNMYPIPYPNWIEYNALANVRKHFSFNSISTHRIELRQAFNKFSMDAYLQIPMQAKQKEAT